MIFDTHVHVWSADRERYPMVPGRERPVEHDGSADTLIRLMDASGVQAALLVQTPWLGEDNRYLVDAMRRYPGRFAALGWLEDPLAPRHHRIALPVGRPDVDVRVEDHAPITVAADGHRAR